MDCIYLDAPNELHLDNGLGDIITIKNTKYVNSIPDLLLTRISEFHSLGSHIILTYSYSWSDTVLWNPYQQMEAFYRDFVCVENAKVFYCPFASQFIH